MENLPKRDRELTPPVELPNKEQFLTDLKNLLKPQNSSELIGTFKAGVIPVILDTLARDTGKQGQEIVTALYQAIESVSEYYEDRNKKAEQEKQEEVKLPVKKPEQPPPKKLP